MRTPVFRRTIKGCVEVIPAATEDKIPINWRTLRFDNSSCSTSEEMVHIKVQFWVTYAPQVTINERICGFVNRKAVEAIDKSDAG